LAENAVSTIAEETTGFDDVKPSWVSPGRWVVWLVRSHRGLLKRGFDVCVAGVALLLATPIFAAVALTIWICDGHPVVFGHVLLGRHGRPFRCLKLRTMRRDGDALLGELLARSSAARDEWAATRKLQDDPRVLGGFGRFLRRWSLDELPQIWNVLRGEMSLVGPRPIVADELVHYDGLAGWYFAVRPGLTGLWQVGGRSDTGYLSRVALDVQYAKAPSLRRDLGILVRTAPAVFACRGAY
jgi:exopolysaccharide production protein ExoY